MSRWKTFRFIFSIWLFIPLMAIAQDELTADGLRISYDIGTIPALYIYPDQQRAEFQADVKLKPKFYGVGEFGVFGRSMSQNSYDYSQQGSFYRIGAEYNAMESEKDDILTLGGRVGTSFFSQQAEDIKIHGYDSIWNKVSLDRLPKQSESAFWLEATISMKVELVANFYLGWTIRGKALIFGPRNEHLEPYSIPGFGRGNNKATVGFNYYICYKIPLNF